MDRDEFFKHTKNLELCLQALQPTLKIILDQLNDQDERIKDIESYLAQKETHERK